jgi:SAM-dependent methyltransferase
MTTTDGVIAAYWDAAAPTFDDEPDHGLRDDRTRRAWAARLARWLPASPADVLDVGCGTGSLTLLAAGAGHRVTGVDLAPAMVAEARRKAAGAGLPAVFRTGDAADPVPGGRDRFDVVLARHLLWTLPDPGAALRTWAGLVRPGGRLVLVEGRWGAAAPPYAAGAPALPWGAGVGAGELAAAVAPLAGDPARIRVEPLSDDPELWGGEVADERYALIAGL